MPVEEGGGHWNTASTEAGTRGGPPETAFIFFKHAECFLPSLRLFQRLPFLWFMAMLASFDGVKESGLIEIILKTPALILGLQFWWSIGAEISK